MASLFQAPVTDEMFGDTSDCFGGQIIFTSAEFESNYPSHDGGELFGVPIDSIGNSTYNDTMILGTPIDSTSEFIQNDTSITNMTTILNMGVGNMSLSEIWDCLDIGCSPQLAALNEQVGIISDLFTQSNLSQTEIDSIFTPQEEIDFNDSMGVSSINDFSNQLGQSIGNLNIDSLMAAAFNSTVSDCENGWDVGLDSLIGGFDLDSMQLINLKNGIASSISATFSSILSNDEASGDPNWFLGEIEGLGNNIKLPTSSSTTNFGKSNVDLYNGKASFTFPLDDIGSKDISVPISVNSNIGGLKVNDQESVLGSNMQFNSLGVITKQVNGYPDELLDLVGGYSYGKKRGFKVVTELSGGNFGVTMNGKSGWIKKLVCKLINKILSSLINQNSNGGSSTGSTQIAGQLGLANLSGLNTNIDKLIKRLKKEHNLVNKNIGVVNTRIYWTGSSFNYLNCNITVSIPIFTGIDLNIGLSIRTGIKIVDVPSPVKYTKKVVGYSHFNDDESMETVDLEPFNITSSDFALQGMPENKVSYLLNQNPMKKRDEKAFFRPNSFSFFDKMKNIFDLFNTSGPGDYPTYEGVSLDQGPDMYNYNFGNYSGSFYIHPDGQIILVPYQDFIIEKTFGDKRNKYDIEEFTFTTPEGVKYTFNQIETSQYDNYSLPIFMKYPEIDVSRENFYKPVIGKVEYPSFKGKMGLVRTMEIKKDYLTNFHIENGPSYTSAWHVTKVESGTTKEVIDFTYETDIIHFNSSKNWTHSFPNFGKNGDDFVTIPNGDLDLVNLRFKTFEWKNGFSELNYSLSEAKVIRPRIVSIDNNRGKKALFSYAEDNPALPSSKLCSKIEIIKNFEFYKGWEFEYTTPPNDIVIVSCEDTLQISEDGQGPAVSAENEYSILIDVLGKDINDKFVYRYPVSIEIMCIKFQIPFKWKKEIKDNNQGNYYFMNAISEFGSLMHLKKYLDLEIDEGFEKGYELQNYQAEHVRNFLRNIKEINIQDSVGIGPIIANFNYIGELKELPKRFSINQDIWGYYNGQSLSKSPFIKQSYNPIKNISTEVFNTDHFGFGENNFDDGRNWEADLIYSKVGQLDSVSFETGAFLKWNFDLQEYPQGSSSDNPLQISEGGLRIKSSSKGSTNGSTKEIEYVYSVPTIINYPVFSNQLRSRVYYENLEEKVMTSMYPLNQWQSNKNGYVGYGSVIEIINNNDDGRILHEFTNPFLEGYEPLNPSIYFTTIIQRKPLKGVSYDDINYGNGPMNYNSNLAPKLNKSWRYGLEVNNKIYDKLNVLKSFTHNKYLFRSMMGNDVGIFKYPKTNYFQTMHYGTWEERINEEATHYIVNALLKDKNGVLAQFVRLLFPLILNDHNYRYIRKDFSYAEIVHESEKVEIESSITRNYFVEGGDNDVNTTYKYVNNSERKLWKKTSIFSNGQISEQEFKYADNSYDPVLDITVLEELDILNYELPIHTKSLINGTLVSGSITDFKKHALDNTDPPEYRYLPETVWGYREGGLVLTGKFEEYNSDGMPTKYELAKYGTSTIPSDYSFFPPIVMSWNNNLLMETRVMSGYGTSTHYNNLCQIDISTDVNGLETNYHYDERRRLDITTSPGGLQVQEIKYDMNPLTITKETTFSDGFREPQVLTTEFDGWGNELKVIRVNDLAILSEKSYDNMFRVTAQTNLGSGAVLYKYEPSVLNQVAEIEDAVGNKSVNTYLGPAGCSIYPSADFNASECQTSFTGISTVDPNGHTTKAWSDALGRSIKSVSGKGGVTVMSYDNYSRPLSITNPIGEHYDYGYNTMGLLASKTIPGKGEERFWYDNSMRLVAKEDAKGHALINDYDNIYRLIKTGYAYEIGLGDPSTTILIEDDVNVLMTDVLLTTEYVPLKTWVDNTSEAILKDGGIVGTKSTVFTLDIYGRVNSTLTNYPNGPITETFAPINDAGISTIVSRNINGENFLYTYDFDDILRQTTTSLDYNGNTTELEEISYNSLDQIETKYLGGFESSYLQKVDYKYDAAGKIVKINDPLNNGCIHEEDLCQLYWDINHVKSSFDITGCNTLMSISLDGILFELDNPIDISNVDAIEEYIMSKINEVGKTGDVSVYYHNYFGTEISIIISIMGTNLTDVILSFDNCEMILQEKECCTSLVLGQGDSTLPGGKLDLFYEELTYDALDISLIEMIGCCEGGLIKNHYKYDADHRLINVHNELLTSEFHDNAYSTNYSYDPAGNITSLGRRGWVPDFQLYLEIDNLEYQYGTGSQLNRVFDNASPPALQKQGFGNSSPESIYSYDGNGNLISDSGKKINTIDYNLLNLPYSFEHINEEHELEYMTIDYTFGGEKIKQTSPDGVRKYIGGLEYKDDVLELIHIPNGRILKSDTGDKYQYMISDHLGNTMVVFEDVDGNGIISQEEHEDPADDEIIQCNQYYSFGMRIDDPIYKFGETPENMYLYNGKEKIGEGIGLDWLAYGARYYDSAIGRWMSVDPLAEKYGNWSPYTYTYNNPIKYIDPDGKEGVLGIDNKNKRVTVNAHYFVEVGKKGFSGADYKQFKGINTTLNNNSYSVTDKNSAYYGYDVKFNLTFSAARSKKDAQNFAGNESSLIKNNQNSGITLQIGGMDIANSIILEDDKSFNANADVASVAATNKVSPNKVLGITTLDTEHVMIPYRSKSNDLTKTHEIFHTLYFDNDGVPSGVSGGKAYPTPSEINVLVDGFVKNKRTK